MPKTQAKIDPTENVKALVKLQAKSSESFLRLQIKRIDDLRKAMNQLRESEFRGIYDLQRQHVTTSREKEKLKARLTNKLAKAEARRIDANALAESRRIDALLDAAASAVTLASTRAELTATTLAERVDTSAKTLAQSVEASAAALRATVTSTVASLEGRLTQLEQSRYRLGGRDEGRLEDRSQTNINRALIYSVLLGIASIIALLVVKK